MYVCTCVRTHVSLCTNIGLMSLFATPIHQWPNQYTCIHILSPVLIIHIGIRELFVVFLSDEFLFSMEEAGETEDSHSVLPDLNIPHNHIGREKVHSIHVHLNLYIMYILGWTVLSIIAFPSEAKMCRHKEVKKICKVVLIGKKGHLCTYVHGRTPTYMYIHTNTTLSP